LGLEGEKLLVRRGVEGEIEFVEDGIEEGYEGGRVAIGEDNPEILLKPIIADLKKNLGSNT
jgi:hypothetical protein